MDRSVFKIILFSGIYITIIILSLLIGRYPVRVQDLVDILTKTGSSSNITQHVILNLRLPRIIGSIFIGAALAGSGTIFQTIFKNPMVSPSVMGASSGAAFGACLGILLQSSYLMINLYSFVCGLGSVGIALLITAFAGRRGKVLVLVLSGMLVSTFFTALISLIKYIADPQDVLPEITYWLMGSIANTTMAEVLVVGIIVITCTFIVLLLRWKITLLSLGDEEATSLGINPSVYRFIVILCSTLMTSAAVSISGIIGWVGLVVPHIARLISPSKFGHFFITSIFLGGIYLLIIDTCARSFGVLEFPLGILTSIIGAPFFAIFILKGKRSA